MVRFVLEEHCGYFFLMKVSLRQLFQWTFASSAVKICRLVSLLALALLLSPVLTFANQDFVCDGRNVCSLTCFINRSSYVSLALALHTVPFLLTYIPMMSRHWQIAFERHTEVHLSSLHPPSSLAVNSILTLAVLSKVNLRPNLEIATKRLLHQQVKIPG